jgi:hypothetical protein
MKKSELYLYCQFQLWMKILCKHFCLPQTFTNFNDLILPTTEKVFHKRTQRNITERNIVMLKGGAYAEAMHVAADDIKYFPRSTKRSKISLGLSRVDDISPCSGV